MEKESMNAELEHILNQQVVLHCVNKNSLKT